MRRLFKSVVSDSFQGIGSNVLSLTAMKFGHKLAWVGGGLKPLHSSSPPPALGFIPWRCEPRLAEGHCRSPILMDDEVVHKWRIPTHCARTTVFTPTESADQTHYPHHTITCLPMATFTPTESSDDSLYSR